jgi:CRP/FNR family transcriptional regulator
MTANPTVAHKLMMALGKKLREITSNLGSMAVQSVTHRLSRFLLKMADKIGKKGEDGIRIKLFLTRKDLAECIGTSFEVVVRCLGKLQKEGVIEIEGKTVIINNRAALEELAEE